MMNNDNLFNKIGSTVLKTDLTRKITLNGVTSALPVYKIKLNELFYNDRNDRIATSIDSYNRNHDQSLTPGKNEEYNKVIEDFIVKSNEQAIFKTKNNIRIVGQREAGVVLPDGRVIDGNRRFTCLRQLSSEAEEFTYFEAIILPNDADEKQIKLLELMIQHGEEQRVDYDPIDMIVGMYHDIVETKILTVSEYAKAIDVPERDVQFKLKMAETFVDFLEFINMPKHWYLIKEFSIYGAINGIGHATSLDSTLRKCEESYREDLKNIIYVNIILGTSNKIVETITKIILSGLISSYIKHTKPLAEEFKYQLDTIPYSTFDELKTIISINSDIKQELSQLLDENLLKSKKNEVRSQPSRNVSKAVTIMKSIDGGVIERLTERETSELKQNLTKLAGFVNQYSDMLDLPKIQNTNIITNAKINNDLELPKTMYTINIEKLVPPVIIENCVISSLCKTLTFNTQFNFIAYFVDKKGHLLSEEHKVKTDNQTVRFELKASVSSMQECWLIIKHPQSDKNEVSQIIPFKVKMNFVSKFDF